MEPFDMSNLTGLLGGFQQKMAEFKEKTAQLRCEGEAGGGLVKVVVTGDNQVVSVSIAEGAMEDREMLEDLVRAATGEALRKVKDEMAKGLQGLTGGLPIPPGLKLF